MAASELPIPAAGSLHESPHDDTVVAQPAWLRMHLLGGFRVDSGEQVIDAAAWRLRKAKSLIKLLALAPEHSLHREELMDRLWPDLAPEAAANNLRYTLHVARRAVRSVPDAPSELLQTQEERVALCPAGLIWVDVEAFETAADAARRSADPAAYHTAIDLYAGDLLPEDRYEDWAAARREALRATYLGLLVEVAQLQEARSEYSEAISALERVVAVEPAHEQAQVARMRLLALTGQRSRALRAYQQLQDALRRELDAEPDPSSQQLYADILATSALPEITRFAESVAAPASGIPCHNLPVPVTSFVGRERELASLTQLLATTRLLTLTGAGGCGKTRLALALAADLVFAFPDGVWLVELAGLVDPAIVPAAVAAVLGIREEPGRPLSATVADAARAKRMLLVLDNCEHLIAPVAQFSVALLGSCPGMQIVATSREALHVPGELTWRVPSLSVPDPVEPATLEALRGVEAVSLFLDRVHLRQPDFILTTQVAPAAIEICRRLDGLPLAIELAAARVPALTLEQLAVRMADTLHVLTTGSRTAVPRHQTLRAALDWSFDLLDPIEQTALTRLAVFASGWTLEAAEAVVAGSPSAVSGQAIAEQEVLDLLSRLVDKSLVQVGGGSREAPYRLLEPIRQYAMERLRAGEDETLARRRYAAFYLEFALRARSELERQQQVEWFERVEREHDNLRALLAWLLDHQDVEAVVQLGWALALFWYVHGHFSEGRRWMEAVLTDGSELSPSSRARALCVAAAMALGQTDLQAVSELSEECLSLISDRPDSEVSAIVLFLLGHCAMQQRDYSRASEFFEESLSLYRSLGDRWGITLALDDLGQVPLLLGDYERSTQVFEECLALSRTAGNKMHIGGSLTNLGRVALLQGDFQRAIQLHEESLKIFRELGYSNFIVLALHRVGWAAILMGDSDRARAALEESLSLAEDQGNSRYIALVIHTLALVLLVQGDHDRATMLLQQSLTMSGDLGVEELSIGCVEGIAAVGGSQGKAERAATLWGAVERLRETAGIPGTGGDDVFYERYRSAARAQLGESAWTAAWAEGRTMTLDQAVAAARAVVEPVPTSVLSQPAAGQDPSILTAREREVAVLIARGLTNRQIAVELKIAQRTVDTHVSHILHKLPLTSRAQVLGWIERHGLLTRDAS